MDRELPPLPKHPDPPLLEEEELEDLFVALATGDYRSALTLEHSEAHQLTMYCLSKQAQLWAQIEQRIKQ